MQPVSERIRRIDICRQTIAKKMRLLILTPEYDGSGGGIMTFYQSLVPALQAHGVAVRVIEGSACHACTIDKSVRVCEWSVDPKRWRRAAFADGIRGSASSQPLPGCAGIWQRRGPCGSRQVSERMLTLSRLAIGGCFLYPQRSLRRVRLSYSATEATVRLRRTIPWPRSRRRTSSQASSKGRFWPRRTQFNLVVALMPPTGEMKPPATFP